MSATAAADAIAAGWRRAAPDDHLVLLPLADVLYAALGGSGTNWVTGPFGGPVPARWLRISGTAIPRGR